MRKAIACIVVMLAIASMTNAIPVQISEGFDIERPTLIPTTVALQPKPGWGNFEPLPIRLSGIYGVEKEDVLFSTSGPTLVALNPKEALYLDFNVRENTRVLCALPVRPRTYTAEIETLTVCATTYKIAGKVDKTIAGIIDSSYDLRSKQFMIWSYLGVDIDSLRTVWEKAYGGTEEEWDAIEATLAKYANMDIGKELKEAMEEGDIKAHFKPDGYSSVTMKLTNVIDEKIVIDVYIGTKLENLGGANQDLGIGETVEVYIPPGYSKTFTVRSYCLNQHKGVPSHEDKLEPSGQVETKVLKTMQNAFRMEKVATGAAQSAVWHQTDGATVYGEAEEIASVEEFDTSGTTDEQGFEVVAGNQASMTEFWSHILEALARLFNNA